MPLRLGTDWFPNCLAPTIVPKKNRQTPHVWVWRL